MKFGPTVQPSGDHYSNISDSDHEIENKATASPLSESSPQPSQQPQQRESTEDYARFGQAAPVPQTNSGGSGDVSEFNKPYSLVGATSTDCQGLYSTKNFQHQMSNALNSGSPTETVLTESSINNLEAPANVPTNVPVTTPAGRFVTIQLTKESFYSPRKKRSRVWEYFDTVDLQTEYFDKRACKQRKNYRYDCKLNDCSYQCYASILNGSTSLLLEHCKKHGIIQRNPKTNATKFLTTPPGCENSMNLHLKSSSSHSSNELKNSENLVPASVNSTNIPTVDADFIPVSKNELAHQNVSQWSVHQSKTNTTYPFIQPINNYKFDDHNRVYKMPSIDIQSTLASLILRNNLPYSFLDDPDFKKLLPNSKPDICTPEAISFEIQTKVSSYISLLADVFINKATSVSLSIDAIKVLENYLIVQLNGFWTDNEFHIHNSSISTFACKNDVNYKQLCNKVLSVTNKLGISSKIFSITFPDNLNKKEVIETIHSGLSVSRKGSSRYFFKGKETTVTSFSSIADSIINSIFDELNNQSTDEIKHTIRKIESGSDDSFINFNSPELYTKVRVIFYFLKNSENFRTGWKTHCSEFPYLDKASNVNIYYQMIRHILQNQYNSFRFFKHHDIYKILQFTTKEYELATKLGDIIELLYTSCENTSTSEQSNISKGLRLYQKTDRLLQKIGDNLVSHKFNLAIKEGRRILEKYFKELEFTLPVLVNSVLDPRYKTQFITKAYGSLEATNIINRIKIFIKTFYSKIQTSQHNNLSKPVIDLSDLSDDDNDDFNSNDHFHDSRSNQAATDIDAYFQDRLERDCLFISIAKWWHDHQNAYPCMAAVARDFLAIPFTLLSDDGLAAIRAGGSSTNLESIMYNLGKKVKATTELNQASKLRSDFEQVRNDLEEASKKQFS